MVSSPSFWIPGKPWGICIVDDVFHSLYFTAVTVGRWICSYLVQEMFCATNSCPNAIEVDPSLPWEITTSGLCRGLWDKLFQACGSGLLLI